MSDAPCPKCGSPPAIRGSGDDVRCESCGSPVYERDSQDTEQQRLISDGGADGNIVIELGDRLNGAVSTMAAEADELAARRPHPDAHLYDIEEGLRFRAEQLDEFLQECYYG